MKKFFAIVSGISVVVFFAVVVPSDAYGFIERGDPYGLPAGCASRIVSAIRSVYPGVDVASVRSWYCRRTVSSKTDPLGAECYGEYTLSMLADDWISHVLSDGLSEWSPTSVDGDMVTISRRTRISRLSAEQLVSHGPFGAYCIRDGSGNVVTWPTVLDWRVYRDGSDVFVQVNYATTGTAREIAEKTISGKVVSVISE